MINNFTYEQLVLTPTFTKREIDVIDLVSKGYSNTRIAEILIIGKRTVDTHYGNLHNKLNIDWDGYVETAISVVRLRMVLIWFKHKNEIIRDSIKKGLVQ